MSKKINKQQPAVKVLQFIKTQKQQLLPYIFDVLEGYYSHGNTLKTS